jgi:hypothetical protein
MATKKNELNIKSFMSCEKYLKSLEAIITEGQDKGIFRKDISIPLLTPLFWYFFSFPYE